MTREKRSPASLLASLPKEERTNLIRSLSPTAASFLRHYWPFFARPNQLPPRKPWRTWLIKAGRGFGKTRTGAETTRAIAGDAKLQLDVFGKVLTQPGCRIALVGRTAADVRDVMIEGESGLLSCFPPNERPVYEPSKRRVLFQNGSIATCYSADQPDLLRGPQHSFVWCDELASWKYAIEALDQVRLGLRLGDDPRMVITTTPRPTRVIRDIIADKWTHVTHGSTTDNAPNLAAPFLREMARKYAGTTLGRQELEGEMLSEMPGALWQRAMFEREGFRIDGPVPPMRRIVVAIDPSATAKETSDEAGIVAAGVSESGLYVVLRDLSGILKPDAWGRRAIDAHRDLKGDRVVAEVNNGGDMVEAVLRTIDPHVPYRAVHASRGKRARAEPIAALYEQGKVRHYGVFSDLEDQLCNFVPGVDAESPDRLDALVWALTDLTESSPVDVAFDPDVAFRESDWRE